LASALARAGALGSVARPSAFIAFPALSEYGDRAGYHGADHDEQKPEYQYLF
jgi:hypothetical protein